MVALRSAAASSASVVALIGTSTVVVVPFLLVIVAYVVVPFTDGAVKCGPPVAASSAVALAYISSAVDSST